jgi:hypothetical protein
MRFELKPMSFGEVLDGAFKVFRSNLGLFIGIEALFSLPSVLITTWVKHAQETLPRGELPSGYLPAMLVLLVCAALLWGAVNAAAVQAVIGEPTSIGKALSRYFKVFWQSAGASLLAGLIGSLWSLLLVIPGVIYYLRRALYWPVLIVEGGTAGNSLKRSRTLVAGKEGKGGRLDRVFGATVVFGVLGWALVLGVGMLVPVGLKATLIGGIATAIPQIVIGPLLPIALVLIYFDARVRDEGYDLELRAQAAGAAPAPPAAPMPGAAGPAGPA